MPTSLTGAERKRSELKKLNDLQKKTGTGNAGEEMTKEGAEERIEKVQGKERDI